MSNHAVVHSHFRLLTEWESRVYDLKAVDMQFWSLAWSPTQQHTQMTRKCHNALTALLVFGWDCKWDRLILSFSGQLVASCPCQILWQCLVDDIHSTWRMRYGMIWYDIIWYNNYSYPCQIIWQCLVGGIHSTWRMRYGMVWYDMITTVVPVRFYGNIWWTASILHDVWGMGWYDMI